MRVEARRATDADVPEVCALYEALRDEMVALKPVWDLTDGFPEPVSDHVAGLVAAEELWIGTIDDVPFGFLSGRLDDLLPQADGRRMATIEHIFTHPEAREVGVGEAMLDAFLAFARDDGIDLFDAVAPPGQRLTKNFFESAGFSARRIVMHHEEE